MRSLLLLALVFIGSACSSGPASPDLGDLQVMTAAQDAANRSVGSVRDASEDVAPALCTEREEGSFVCLVELNTDPSIGYRVDVETLRGLDGELRAVAGKAERVVIHQFE